MSAVSDVEVSRDSPTAEFDVSRMVKRGEFTVAVKACTDSALTNCGDYGPHGTITLTLPAPTPTATPGTR